MSLTGIIKGTGDSGFGWSTTAGEVAEGLDLSDQTILITGCNSGIGLEMMRVVGERGATVIAAARTRQKAEDAGEEVDGETIPVACELSDPASVRMCAEEVAELDETLDALVCNAGIMALPDHEKLFGYEKQFFVNHVGHFMLVTELLGELTDDGRVVMLSSDAHTMGYSEGIRFEDLSADEKYSAWKAYGQSKLANLLFARELARRFDEDETSRVANAVHPGPIDTNLTRNMNPVFQFLWSFLAPLFLKTIPEGAATQTWAAVHPDTARLNGEYMADCNVANSSSHGRDDEMARRLWEVTEEIVDEVTEASGDPASDAA